MMRVLVVMLVVVIVMLIGRIILINNGDNYDTRCYPS